MAEIFSFFADLFNSIVLISIDGFRPFYFLGACLVVGAVLTLAFHNK